MTVKLLRFTILRFVNKHRGLFVNNNIVEGENRRTLPISTQSVTIADLHKVLQLQIRSV